MDDQTLNQSLKQTLTDHARSAIPDDYDRWTQIHDALSQEGDPMNLQSLRVAPPSPRRTRRLIFIIAAALLLTTSAVYAVYQQVFPPPINDPGVEGIQREGYTTELNLVQRTGDVEIQLNWGYIDTSRVVLDYEIFAINPDGTRTTDHRYVLYKALLKNRDAVLEERLPNIDTSGNVQPGIFGKGTLTYEYPHRFDPETLPDTMNFQLEVLVAEARLPAARSVEVVLRSLLPAQINQFMVPLDYLYERPNRLPKPESTAEPGVNASGPMLFDFALPVQRAIVWEPNQTVEVNGNAVTLTRVSASPSELEFELCFKTREGTASWMTYTEFTLDGNPHPAWGGGGSSSSGESTHIACSRTYHYEFTAPGMPLEIRVLSISGSVAVDREVWRSRNPQPYLDVQKQFAERGVEMEVDLNAEGKLEGYHWPSASDPNARSALIELGYLMEGPWVFNVEIPEP